jgi:NADH dehydrogenase FAD-containing subunit
MSAQGAVAQGDHAARTIVRLSRGEALVPFRTVDWGYLVPMANWRSCGNLFGINVSGNAATFLHYLINAWRSRSVQAKAAVLLHGLAGSRGMESRYPA